VIIHSFCRRVNMMKEESACIRIHFKRLVVTELYESVSISFRTGRLERELQMV
jgi:hypothetical protein